MEWRKIKNIFCPDHYNSWMVSHASNPTPEKISASVFRIYFSCRNAQNESYIGYADVDFNDDFKVKNVSENPVLAPGELGTFDDSGVTVTCIQQVKEKMHLYYLGWNLKVKVPYGNAIGLAVRDEVSGRFEKYSPVPVMDRSIEDPLSLSYPTVLFDNGIYRMWYGTNLKWEKTDGVLNYAFIIKYAESTDGINWQRSNQIHIDLLHKNEAGISRPFVLKIDGLYHMWYSFKGGFDNKEYHIGYAESRDGFNWERKDNEVGIGASQTGWDSEMVCYAYVLEHENELYMLYNGNGYGKTGFGIAKLVR